MRAAQGYCELGMFDDALSELGALPGDAQHHPKVVELRLAICMQARRWQSALSISQELCRVAPQNSTGYIHAAFCLHELGKTAEARDVLLNGPETLHSDPTFHYNLACYECRLGNVEIARMHLDRSVKLDKKFGEIARNDPDLAVLHGRV
jgi:predicted Zn-dependent protease